MEWSNQINKTYEVENPLIQYINRYFNIDSAQIEWMMQTTEIIDTLKVENVGGMDLYSLQRNITSTLKSLGLQNRQRRIPGYSNPIRVWEGIKKKD